jgi:hypothetical protein
VTASPAGGLAAPLITILMILGAILLALFSPRDLSFGKKMTF